MNIYHYKEGTNEYTSTSNESSVPAFATTIAPPSASSNQIPVFLNGAWSLKADFRNTNYYKKINGEKFTITQIDETIPNDCITLAPSNNLFKPKWNGTQWVENAIIYKNRPVTCKADVDIITRSEIALLDEEKVKTERLKALDASQPPPQIWLNFVIARDQIVQEGNELITQQSW
jgi:hypothetical protein